MPLARQLIGRLSNRCNSGTRVARHAISTGTCTCAECSAGGLSGSKTSYHAGIDASVSVSVDEKLCTGARSCRCSDCRAGTSGALLSGQGVPFTSAAIQAALQRLGTRERMVQGYQGPLSSGVRAASSSYSSLSVSKPWKPDVYHSRAFSTVDNYQGQLDAINDAFVEARDEIEYAQEDSETVYFEEGLKTAQTAVADALGKYNSLLDSLGEDERGKLQRSMGMKMEQLKAELHTVEQTHA